MKKLNLNKMVSILFVISFAMLSLIVAMPTALAWQESPSTDYWYINANYGDYHSTPPLVIDIDGNPADWQLVPVGTPVTIAGEVNPYAASCAGYANEAYTEWYLEVNGPSGSNSTGDSDYDYSDSCAEVNPSTSPIPLSIAYSPTTPGIHTIYMSSYAAVAQYYEDVADEYVDASLTFVVYDAAGGFVTGGGWITSPAGAVPPTTSNVTVSGTSGDTSIDPGAAYASYYLRYVGNPPPAGYDPDHNYQWGSPAIFTPSPEAGPVTLSGKIDVGNQTVGQVAMIGLLDQDDLAAGNSSFQRGAYIYIYRSSSTSWKIGPSDGNDGGEIVQTFATIADTDLPADGKLNVTFTVDGTADGTACAAGPYTAPVGCMTLQITGGSVNATLTDSYGDVIGTNSASPEFANGAVLGWDDYIGSNVGFELTVPSMTSGSPEGKATFGFVSKYKKGASVPTGETEFQFNAGDLNFHSSSYDWLIVTGSNYAKFKGKGTINGEMAPNGEAYKFMLWAGDNDPDTFRIKIWYEEDDTEVIAYDNGMDQEIGGGSIVIHKK